MRAVVGACIMPAANRAPPNLITRWFHIRVRRGFRPAVGVLAFFPGFATPPNDRTCLTLCLLLPLSVSAVVWASAIPVGSPRSLLNPVGPPSLGCFGEWIRSFGYSMPLSLRCNRPQQPRRSNSAGPGRRVSSGIMRRKPAPIAGAQVREFAASGPSALGDCSGQVRTPACRARNQAVRTHQNTFRGKLKSTNKSCVSSSGGCLW